MNYFAYGSNINLEHMRRLCGWHCHVLGVATLPDYDFGADSRGFATIKAHPGKRVVGVVFDIDQQGLDALDDFEGYPEVFGRQEVEVVDVNNKKLKVWVYLEKPEEFGGKFMKEEYMRRVLVGAYENHLPKDWIEFLESFPTL